jgi:hypothetical protein
MAWPRTRRLVLSLLAAINCHRYACSLPLLSCMPPQPRRPLLPGPMAPLAPEPHPMRDSYVAFLHSQIRLLHQRLRENEHELAENQAPCLCESFPPSPLGETPAPSPVPTSPAPPSRPRQAQTETGFVPLPSYRDSILPSSEPVVETYGQSENPLGGTTFAVVVVLMLVPVALITGVMLLSRRRRP